MLSNSGLYSGHFEYMLYYETRGPIKTLCRMLTLYNFNWPDTQNSKMASSGPVKMNKLVDVKLEELPRWMLMREVTPNVTAGAFQRGYYRIQQVRQCEERGRL